MKRAATEPALDGTSKLSSISLLRFLCICFLSIVLITSLPDAVFAPLNRATASLAGLCIGLFGMHPVVTGDLVSVDGFRVKIITECTALYSIVLFASFVMSVPNSMKARFTGLLLGFPILAAFNIFRVAVITTTGASYPILFEVIHVYLGQIVMIIVVCSACMIWLRWSASSGDPIPFIIRALILVSVLFLPWLAFNKLYVGLLDRVVIFFFSLIGYNVTIPRPFAIYNHTFAVPLFLSLILAYCDGRMRRRLGFSVAGIFIIAGWHILFRVSHVIWTAFDVNEMEHSHQMIYVLGQYLLPFFLWILVTALPPGLVKGLGRKALRFMPVVLISLFITWPAGARGEAVVAIQSNGHGGFTLRADGLNGVAGGEIRLDYVTYGQTAPNVSVIGLGGQAGLRAATDSPGTIVFSFTSRKPLNGGGMLATLTLAGQDGDTGRILSLSALLKNDKGVEESARTSISNPSDGEVKPLPASSAKTRTRDKLSTAFVAPGAAKPLQEIVLTAPLTSKQRPPAGPVSFRRLESVLDRFRRYAEKLTPTAIDLLFVPIGDGGFLQEPAVLLADGLAEARLTFRPGSHGEEITCFIITGGHSTALRKGKTAGEWILNLTPERGALTTSVTVQTAQSTVEYPLIVAPPMSLFRPATDKEDLPYVHEYVRAANERAHPRHFGEAGTKGGRP